MALTNHHSEKEVNQLFSRVADKYDLMNNVISLSTQRHWRKKLLGHLRIKPGMSCLDLCCGTGDLTVALARQVGLSGQVVGLDFNSRMLNLAKQKVQQFGLSKEVNLVQADAMSLPFSANSFDIVTIGFGLRNVPDAGRVLAEIIRVLKPGGQFGCLEMSQPTNPLVKIGWQAYFKFFPYLAKLWGANTTDYRYLKDTAESFVSAQTLLTMMEQGGFHQCTYQKLNWGAGAIHFGCK